MSGEEGALAIPRRYVRVSARFDQKAVKIGFFMEQSKIRFEINPESGEKAN